MPTQTIAFGNQTTTIQGPAIKRGKSKSEEMVLAAKAALAAEAAKVAPKLVPEETEDSPMTPERKATLIIGESLENDTTERSELCPKCGGGSDKEKSFCLSKDVSGYLFWRCFRASCGYRGSTGGGSKGTRTASREATPFRAAILPLTEEQTDYFSDEYGVDQVNSRLGYAPEIDGFVFTVRGPSQQILGHHVRWFDGRRERARSYPEVRAIPFMSWYSPEYAKYGHPIIVVEDCLSAMKTASIGSTTVALLGTLMDYERAFALREVSSKLVIALDKGTLPLAISYRDKFSHMFDSVTVWCLDKDLKYVTRERIKRAMAGATDFITNR